MKKSVLTLAALIGCSWATLAQNNSQILYNADGDDKGSFEYWVGELDPSVQNPDINTVNESPNVVFYQRDPGDSMAVVTFNTTGMMNAMQYAGMGPSLPKFKMMVYTDAPTNTKVQVVVGNKDVHDYPDGFHSAYEATITKQMEWEEITFNYMLTVPGGMMDTTMINKIVFMFAPGKFDGSTYYFDNIMGPEFIDFTSVQQAKADKLSLKQNYPNPARNSTRINYSLKSAGEVQLTVYNVMGQELMKLVDGYHTAGEHSVLLNTLALPEGVYFYTMKIGDAMQTKKLSVTR